MCNVFSLPEPRNKEKNWDLLIHWSRFPLEYVKHNVQNLQKGYETDQYVAQNMTWSGVYLRATLSYAFLQKILKLVSLIATGPEVYVTTMTIVLYNSYDYLVDTLNHMKSLKLKDNPWENVAYCCDTIVVDVELLETT